METTNLPASSSTILKMAVLTSLASREKMADGRQADTHVPTQMTFTTRETCVFLLIF